MLEELLVQAAKAAAYYAALIVLMRIAGKRLAGQTTTFDLIVLITLGVVLQSTALQKGMANGIVFVVTARSRRQRPSGLSRNTGRRRPAAPGCGHPRCPAPHGRVRAHPTQSTIPRAKCLK